MATSDANFIGFVTRKDKDTGVNLLAKIVTPNKRLSTLKLVRVKVKANALDDYSCCVIDHATMKKIIDDSQDLTAVSESFQFLYNGEHGTNIEYAIENSDSASPLTDYLSDDGTITGRPKYSPSGSADATGYIRITVTKNDAEVSSRIMVTVKGMTADEVLNSDKVYSKTSGSLSEFLWNKIKGQNENHTNRGFEAIMHQLDFNNAKSIYVDDISDTPISCAWVVEYDEVGDYMKNNPTKFPNSDLSMYTLANGSGSRICMDADSENYGKVILPTYKDCVSAFTNNKWAALMPITPGNEVRNRNFRIGKYDSSATTARLKLRVTLSLGEATPLNVVYNCATVSDYMTNKEVADFIKDVMQIKVNGNLMSADGRQIDIIVPQPAQLASVTPYTIAIFGNGHFTNLSATQYEQLCLESTTLANAVALRGSPSMRKTDSSGDYEASSSLFCDGLFKPTELDGTNPYDDWRVSTIGVGNSASGAKTGFYKADEILDNYADLESFTLKFTIEIQRMSEKDGDVQVIPFENTFTLKRAT